MVERRQDGTRQPGRASKRPLEREDRSEPAGVSNERISPPVGPAPMPSDALLEAAIEGARAMGEWNRAMRRDESPPGVEEENPAAETGGPRGQRR